ncbi:MAG: hypothetical protein NC821_04445 [Candidatus Omnitrophica bacterium]|nr:hypothetical protein [Candidatus Omnitrophota bacterium]
MKTRIRVKGFLGILVFIFFFLTFFITPGFTQIPHKINYQGYLTDSGGNPVNGTVSILFSIYDVSSGGTALWSETQSVNVNQGIYSVNLGDNNPVNLAFDKPYYLGVKVGSDSEMTPRIPLTSVGYAFRANTAQTVETIGSHTHSASDITSGTLDNARFSAYSARRFDKRCNLP